MSIAISSLTTGKASGFLPINEDRKQCFRSSFYQQISVIPYFFQGSFFPVIPVSSPCFEKREETVRFSHLQILNHNCASRYFSTSAALFKLRLWFAAFSNSSIEWVQIIFLILATEAGDMERYCAPRPNSSDADFSSPAISPHTPTGFPTRRNASMVWRISLKTAG